MVGKLVDTGFDERFQRITKGESWELEFADYFFGEDESVIKLREALQKEVFTVGDSDLTHKVINQWTQKGILKDRRGENKSAWRRLTVVDLVWARILAELRQFGLPLEKLQESYNSLFYLGGDKSKPCELLQFGLSYCFRKVKVSVIVFPDGWADVATKREMKLSRILLGEARSFIQISLNECAKSVIPKLPEALDSYFELTLKPAERQVISEIRSGSLDKLEILLENGEVKRLDKHYEELVDGKDLDSLANKILFGEIKVLRRSGKNVLVRFRDVSKF